MKPIRSKAGGMQTVETISAIDQSGMSEAYPRNSGRVALASTTAPPIQSPVRLTLDAMLAANKPADPGIASALGSEEGKPFGIFYGLWSVFLIYVGAGIVGAVGYEIWCLLTK
jgi:hypothetical protein